MKHLKTTHGIHKFIKDFLKDITKCVSRKTTNNYRKMHGLPMRRKNIK